MKWGHFCQGHHAATDLASQHQLGIWDSVVLATAAIRMPSVLSETCRRVYMEALPWPIPFAIVRTRYLMHPAKQALDSNSSLFSLWNHRYDCDANEAGSPLYNPTDENISSRNLASCGLHHLQRRFGSGIDLLSEKYDRKVSSRSSAANCIAESENAINFGSSNALWATPCIGGEGTFPNLSPAYAKPGRLAILQ